MAIQRRYGVASVGAGVWNQSSRLLTLMRPTSQLQRARAAAPAADVPTRDIVGVPVSMVDYERTTQVMDRLVTTRERGYVCVAPVHAVMEAQDDPEMLAALRGATLVVPDGIPVVWAANLLGESPRLDDRVYGPELMLR